MSLLTKAIGITALGLSAYDTLATSNRLSDIKSKNLQLNRINDAFLRTNYSESNSQLSHRMQKWTRNWYMSDNWLFKIKDNILAYTSTLFDKIGDNLTTFALAATTLIFGKSKISPIKLPIAGKIAAALLGVQAISYVCRNVFGIGTTSGNKPNSINV